MIRTTLFLLFLCISTYQVCYAHGDLHERILVMSGEIEANPDDAELYFERAKLYFYHKQFDLSIHDLDKSNKLGLDDPLTDLFYAKAHQKLENKTTALQYTEKILASDNKNVNAMKIKAEVLYASGKYMQSAETYSLLLKTAKRTLPENYLDGARSWKDAQKTNEAVLLINQGIDELGTLPVFLKKKKEYLLAEKQYADALEVQDLIIEKAQRKERSYFEAAQIALLKKDCSLAKKYIDQSEEAFKSLPTRIQKNKAMRELSASITQTKNDILLHL